MKMQHLIALFIFIDAIYAAMFVFFRFKGDYDRAMKWLGRARFIILLTFLLLFMFIIWPEQSSNALQSICQDVTEFLRGGRE